MTYLLSPLRACPHIRPTPRNTILFCQLPALRPGPNSTREPSSLAPRTFSTSLLVVPPPVSEGCPAHGYSWNGCRWHYVNMANPPPSSFLDGKHPSSLVELLIGYFVWPKDVENSSKAVVLEYFQHVAYSFSHFSRLCSI